MKGFLISEMSNYDLETTNVGLAKVFKVFIFSITFDRTRRCSIHVFSETNNSGSVSIVVRVDDNLSMGSDRHLFHFEPYRFPNS